MIQTKQDPANKWEELYKAGDYRGKYPNEDVIRFIQRHFSDRTIRKKIRVLDWGVGTGRHTRYLAREGFLTYGVEVSASGAELTRKWLNQEGLDTDVHVIDGVHTSFEDNFFDAIIDCAVIQHNKIDEIKKIIIEMRRILKSGGHIFSFCKSTHDSLYKDGEELEKNTYYVQNFVETPTVIHFFDEKELKDLWKNYTDVEIEYTERTINNMSRLVAHHVLDITK